MTASDFQQIDSSCKILVNSKSLDSFFLIESTNKTKTKTKKNQNKKTSTKKTTTTKKKTEPQIKVPITHFFWRKYLAYQIYKPISIEKKLKKTFIINDVFALLKYDGSYNLLDFHTVRKAQI